MTLVAFTRSNSRINRGKETNQQYDLERMQIHPGTRILNDIPRTALADVDAANIFEPFSNSNDPLFHDNNTLLHPLR